MYRRSVVALLAAAGLSAAFVSAHPPERPTDVGPAFAVDDAMVKTVAWYEERIRTNPGDTMSISGLAGTLLRVARQTTRHEDFEKAARAFERLGELNPGSTNAAIGLAHARLGQHRFAEALKHAQAARFGLPQEKQALALLGDAHLAIGNTIEASLIFEELERQDLSLDSLARLALVREAQGRMDEAKVAMAEAVKAGELLKVERPQIAWCESMLGEYALATGDLDGAEKWFSAALAGAPGMHHAAFRKAQILDRRGEIEGAEKEMIRLAAQFPLPRYWVALGEVHIKHGEPADLAAANEYFDKAEAHMKAEVDRGDLGHARELVEFWLAHRVNGASAEGRATVERAVELARRDLREIRHDAEAYEVAAWAEFKAGRPAEAETLMRSALERNPTSAKALRRAAEIAAARNDLPAAEGFRARALASDPTGGVGAKGR
ncbi:MAG: tetratricopeptide repeat protein [Phycisphaerales bacterium]